MQVAIRGLDQRLAVTAWRVAPLDRSLSDTSEVSLAGKSFLHYLMLTLAVLSPLTIIAALVVLARSKGLKKRPLWALGSLFGVGKLLLNWDTGALSLNPLHLQFFNAGVVKAPANAPWYVSVSVPLVAILFLVWRKKLMERSAAQ